MDLRHPLYPQDHRNYRVYTPSIHHTLNPYIQDQAVYQRVNFYIAFSTKTPQTIQWSIERLEVMY